MGIVDATRRTLRRFGIDVRLYNPDSTLDPWSDMAALLVRCRDPVALDVGANIGQTVLRLRKTLPDVLIHAFEPSPFTFGQLQTNVGAFPNVTLNNSGVGASVGIQDLFENSSSDMSSFLELGPEGWGKVTGKISVPVTTVDVYCEDKRIDRIGVLKIDTQGFDLEVLKGADSLLTAGRIGLVYLEVSFAKIYQNIPRFDKLYGFLADRDYCLVAVYDHHRNNRILAWTDVMFMASSWRQVP